jgi:GT2 family glycosyltransferase
MGLSLNTTEQSGVPYRSAPDLAGLAQASAASSHVDCAIVIVTYNSSNDIVALLGSLAPASGTLTVRVVVVDNASTDGTLQIVRHTYPDAVCVAAGGNLGYSAGINIGRKFAGDWSALLVLNPDIVLEADSIATMMAALDDPQVGVVVPMLLDQNGMMRPSLRRDPTLTRAIGEGLLGDRLGSRPGWLSDIVRTKADYHVAHPVDWATGAVMLISASCDHAVGPWDERFFLYAEEVDYAFRVRASGFRVEYVPHARARHRGAGSGRSDALVALMAVNRIRYIEKRGYRRRAYRAVVILHELLRAKDSGHRAALYAVARRSSWPRLIASLRGPTQRSGVEPMIVNPPVSEAR